MLRDRAAQGAGVLVASSDFEEVVTLCDRALVVGRGLIAADLPGLAMTLESLLTRSSMAAEPAALPHQLEKGMSNSMLQRSVPAPSAPRASSATLSNLFANYGLLFVFLLIMLVFGLLRSSSFFSATNLDAILVSQSVTAILALATMVLLATKQFDLSIGYHLGVAQVLIVDLQVSAGLPGPCWRHFDQAWSMNVIRTLLSVLVLAFSFSGVQQLGTPFYVQFFFNGSILIVAVGVSVYAAQWHQRAATVTKPSAG